MILPRWSIVKAVTHVHLLTTTFRGAWRAKLAVSAYEDGVSWLDVDLLLCFAFAWTDAPGISTKRQEELTIAYSWIMYMERMRCAHISRP